MKRGAWKRRGLRVLLFCLMVAVCSQLSVFYLGERAEGARGGWEAPAKVLLGLWLGQCEPRLFFAGGQEASVPRYKDPAYRLYLQGQAVAGEEETAPVIQLLTDLRGENGAVPTPDEQERETEGTVAETEPGAAAPSKDALSVAAMVADRYSREQLADFTFLLRNLYTVHGNTAIYPDQLRGAEFVDRDLRFSVDPEEAQVLIYHTHYSELYADSDPADLTTGVIGVGAYLAELLTEKYGIKVIHDTTPYDYNSSYSMAGKRVSEILAANPGIRVVIDLHRDAAGGQRLVTKLDGKDTARIMFFNGMCQTTSGPLPNLSNPYREDNLAFSLQLKLIAETHYPGLTRKNYLKAYQYNQNLCPLSTLIEAGADTNTLQEAKNAMEPLADILGKVLVKN